jgi:hypothetical protein
MLRLEPGDQIGRNHPDGEGPDSFPYLPPCHGRDLAI